MSLPAKYYTGVGSRTTPPDILTKMTEIAKILSEAGFTLRSGGAPGADYAFEIGATKKEIFTWEDSTTEAEILASTIHPAWHNCYEHSRKLHGRNVMQVLGKTLSDPVHMVICWTPGAKEVGGTRTAIVLAKQHGIPVYNMADSSELGKLSLLCDSFAKLAEYE